MSDTDVPKVTTKVVTITPDMATQWLEGKCHNRSIRDSKVQEYAADMKTGRWHLTHQGIAFTPDDALLDGQHRLFAIIEAGVPITMLVASNVPESYMINIDGGLLRSVADVSMLSDPSITVNSTHVACARTMMTAGPLLKLRQPTRSETLAFMQKHWKAISFAQHLMPTKIRGITIAPVYATLARAYYTIAEEKLVRFAEVLKTGQTETPSEGAAVSLRNWLMDVRAGVRVAGVSGKGLRQSANLYYGKAERALAAFVRGETPRMLYPAADELFALPEESRGHRKTPTLPTINRKRKAS